MSLAQVVHKISTDSEFAAEWGRDPKAALQGKGYKLSQEEIAFLSDGLRRTGGREVQLGDLVRAASSWRG